MPNVLAMKNLSDGLTRTFLRSLMRDRRLSTLELAEWIGCAEAEVWNLLARTDGASS